jgi:hypothetical protein
MVIRWGSRIRVGWLVLICGMAAHVIQAQVLHAQEPLTASPQAGVPSQAAPVATGIEGLRPGEVYQQAMKPLDLVRSSLDNWSDTELGALTSGIRMARMACDAVALDKPRADAPESPGKPAVENSVSVTTDEDLYDLIRLCALGQDWNPSLAAAKKYLAGGATAHRSQAYSLSINAFVHINDLDGAVEAAHEMLHDVPYDAEVGYTTQFLKTYLTQAVDPKALSFAMEEHGALVEALKSGSTLKSLHGEAVMGVGTLYASGMQLAFLERYAGNEGGAARTVLELEAAVAASQAVTAADRQLMEAVRKQYGLVGSVLPEIDAQGLTSATAAAKKFRSDVGFVTIVEVFPDYCPQCVKTMAGLAEFAAGHAAAKVHAYGLMVRDDMSAVPPDRWKDLKGTSTLAVKPEAVHMLGAVDYPFLVVTDEHGLVYYVGAIPSNAFVPNGYMEQVIGRIVGELAVVRNPVGGKSKPMVKKPM